MQMFPVLLCWVRSFLSSLLFVLSGLICVDVHVFVHMILVVFVYIANFPTSTKSFSVQVSTQLWKDFNLKWNWRRWNWVPSEEWNLTEGLVSHKCLIRRLRLISSPMNLPIFKSMNLTVWTLARLPPLCTLCHKYNQHQTLKGLACSYYIMSFLICNSSVIPK